MHCVTATLSKDQHIERNPLLEVHKCGLLFVCQLTILGRLSTLQELGHSGVGAVLDSRHQVQAVHLHQRLADHRPLLQGGEGLTGDHLVTPADCGAGIPATAGHG